MARQSLWTAIKKPVATLDTELAALQTDNPSAQIEKIIPIGEVPTEVQVVYSVPV